MEHREHWGMILSQRCFWRRQFKHVPGTKPARAAGTFASCRLLLDSSATSSVMLPRTDTNGQGNMEARTQSLAEWFRPPPKFQQFCLLEQLKSNLGPIYDRPTLVKYLLLPWSTPEAQGEQNSMLLGNLVFHGWLIHCVRRYVLRTASRYDGWQIHRQLQLLYKEG